MDPGFHQNTVWDSENEKYPDGKRDFADSREAELTKIWARDAVFFSPSVWNSGGHTF